MNHNFFQPPATDQPVLSFLVAGIESRTTKFNSPFWHSFTTNLNATIKQTWVGQSKFFVDDCSRPKRKKPVRHSDRPSHRNYMRAQSAVLIGAIETRARTNARLYKLQLDSLTPADVPGQDLESAKRTLWNKFYADLELSATEEFNQAQASTLIESNNYILMTSHWTSLSANFPLMSERIVAVDAYAGRFKSYASLPFLFTLSHTRFRESQRTGKLFLTINAQLAFNNSFIGNQLLQIDRSEFTAHGGVDTLSFSKTSDPKFIGKFKTFLTPMVTLKGIFFPTESHIGLSLSITKSFLDYNPLNFVIGIPVVLIDKEGHPAANFEFQVQCFDVNHTVFPNMNLTDKTSVSLTIGVPFSKIMH